MRSVQKSQEEEKSNPDCRRFSIPRSRVLVCDLLQLEKSLPTVSHFREFDLGRLKQCRDEAAEKIAWPVLFIKAYATVAAKHPALRQSWMRFPRPFIYQHPHSVAMLSVKRSYEDEEWLFFASFDKPEAKELVVLQNRLENYRDEPVEQVFRWHYKAAHLPTWLRRSLMWIWLNWMGDRRARKMGTFGITTVGSRGTVIQDPPGMLTSTMTYGPFDESGKCRVTIAYDHRLMDGWYIAQVLEELEKMLNGAIAEEVAGL
ncbi:2-oxo acid dehydrogenase subunit E2 [Verrucomicrobiales bacterium]|nr:2-oxo acid dehydrogenase subunit E2 [Verrucomicrobiales bacterium]